MTVAELIKKLRNCNQDAVVGTENDMDFYPLGTDVRSVDTAWGYSPHWEGKEFKNVVILETTSPQVAKYED